MWEDYEIGRKRNLVAYDKDRAVRSEMSLSYHLQMKLHAVRLKYPSADVKVRSDEWFTHVTRAIYTSSSEMTRGEKEEVHMQYRIHFLYTTTFSLTFPLFVTFDFTLGYFPKMTSFPNITAQLSFCVFRLLGQLLEACISSLFSAICVQRPIEGGTVAISRWLGATLGARDKSRT